MKICWADREYKDFMYRAFYEPCVENGHEIVSDCDTNCDFIFNAAFKCPRTFYYANEYPNIPIITYCWDYYKWNVDPFSPFQYDKFYGTLKYFNELMKRSWKVFSPNEGTRLRLKEYLGINSEILYTHIPTYDHPSMNGNYIYDPLRLYPRVLNGYGEPTVVCQNDQIKKSEELRKKVMPCQWSQLLTDPFHKDAIITTWSMMACEDLNIPYVRTDHRLDEPQFRKVVSDSNLMVSTYYEASTGGMTLVEGLWNGKRSLVSNSPYMGANEYLGPYGFYFQHDSYDDFKSKLFDLWSNYEQFPVDKTRDYINSKFSKQEFVKNLNYHLEQYKSISKKLSIHDFITKMQNKEFFSFARYGDGELNCIWRTWYLKNCDGCHYTEDLRSSLISSFDHINDDSFIYGLQNVGFEYFSRVKSDSLLSKVNWHDSEFLTDTLRSGQLAPFFEQLSKMNVILIGNEDKASFSRFNFHYIKIPKNNSFEVVDEIENEILDYGQEGVYLFTAGMTSNVLISRLHGILKNSFLIDIGHILDIFCGVTSRNYHNEITQEIIDKNLQ